MRYNGYKENQSTALMVGLGKGKVSNYGAVVGVPELEKWMVE